MTGMSLHKLLRLSLLLQRLDMNAIKNILQRGKNRVGQKQRERDAKELEQDIQMLPKKDTMLSTQKTKVVVKVSQQQTEENLMEE